MNPGRPSRLPIRCSPESDVARAALGGTPPTTQAWKPGGGGGEKSRPDEADGTEGGQEPRQARPNRSTHDLRGGGEALGALISFSSADWDGGEGCLEHGAGGPLQGE